MQDKDGVQHDTNEAKADILAAHFFPPPRDADLSDIANHCYPPELEISKGVSAEDVAKVLKTSAPDKAPRTGWYY